MRMRVVEDYRVQANCREGGTKKTEKMQLTAQIVWGEKSANTVTAENIVRVKAKY